MVPPGLGPLPQTGLTHLKLVKMRHAFKGTHHASPLEKSCLAPPGFLLLGPKEKESYRTGGGGKGEEKDDGELQAGEQDEKDRRGQKGTCVMAPTWSVPKRTCST